MVTQEWQRRANRVIEIYRLLEQRPRSVRELAAELGVSQRTIQRDISEIESELQIQKGGDLGSKLSAPRRDEGVSEATRLSSRDAKTLMLAIQIYFQAASGEVDPAGLDSLRTVGQTMPKAIENILQATIDAAIAWPDPEG